MYSSFTLDVLKFAQYIDDLMEAVAAACQQTSVAYTPDITVIEPPVLCTDLNRPDKQEGNAQQKGRFSKVSLGTLETTVVHRWHCLTNVEHYTR